MSSPDKEKEQKVLNEIIKFSTRKPMIDKSYNKFQRTHEIMQELINSQLPLEVTELSNISNKELVFLKSSIELMADYLNSLGFDFINHKDEILMPIYEEFEKRRKNYD